MKLFSLHLETLSFWLIRLDLSPTPGTTCLASELTYCPPEGELPHIQGYQSQIRFLPLTEEWETFRSCHTWSFFLIYWRRTIPFACIWGARSLTFGGRPGPHPPLESDLVSNDAHVHNNDCVTWLGAATQTQPWQTQSPSCHNQKKALSCKSN